MIYKKYQHVEKYGGIETRGILEGDVYLFHKIDGTNSCVYLDENNNLAFGSRKNILSLEKDNHGFFQYFLNNKEEACKIRALLAELPKNSIVYGEWLIPVNLKVYNAEAWRHFYIFDIVIYEGIDNVILKNDELSRRYERYLSYEEYKELCDRHNLLYIPLLKKLHSPTIEEVTEYLDKTTFLIDKPNTAGEGIVIKNYSYKNEYGRRIWAKLIRADFLKAKSSHRIESHNNKEENPNEYRMLLKYAGPEYIKKEVAKYRELHPEHWDLECFKMSSFPKLLDFILEEFILDNIMQFYNDNRRNASLNITKLRGLLAGLLKAELL